MTFAAQTEGKSFISSRGHQTNTLILDAPAGFFILFRNYAVDFIRFNENC